LTLSADTRNISRNNNTPAATDDKKPVENDNNTSTTQQELAPEQLKTATELQKCGS